MNPIDSAPPRRFCRLVRWVCSLAGDPQNAASKHCKSCEACRDYFQFDQQFEKRLRREASTRIIDLPEGLERRIQSVVERKEPTPARSPQISWALTGLAVGALAAVMVIRIQNTRIGPVPPAATVQDVVAVAQTLHRTWLGTVSPNAVKLVENNPLQTEIASVQSDARSALNFLALNFLPTSPNSRAPSEAVPVEASHSG